MFTFLLRIKLNYLRIILINLSIKLIYLSIILINLNIKLINLSIKFINLSIELILKCKVFKIFFLTLTFIKKKI